VAPWDADGLDWTAGMGEENLVEYAAAQAGRSELERLLPEETAAMVGGGAAAVQEGMSTLLSEQDRAVFGHELGEDLAAALIAGLEPGAEGWIEDDLSHVAPWGFDVAGIRVPVLIWHGTHDLFVNPAHGDWLAANVAGAEARIRTDDGHLTLYAHVGEVHDWLLERL
jgi:pimeloyl-ACP methyl ester carboxylesterase